MTWVVTAEPQQPSLTRARLDDASSRARFRAEAQDADLLLVELPPPGPAARGRLSLFIDGSIERALDTAAAPSARVASCEDAEAALADQLERVRTLGKTGLALLLASLAAIADNRGELESRDSATLRWWLSATQEWPVKVLFDAADERLGVYGPPRPLAELVAQSAQAARRLLDAADDDADVVDLESPDSSPSTPSVAVSDWPSEAADASALLAARALAMAAECDDEAGHGWLRETLLELSTPPPSRVAQSEHPADGASSTARLEVSGPRASTTGLMLPSLATLSSEVAPPSSWLEPVNTEAAAASAAPLGAEASADSVHAAIAVPARVSHEVCASESVEDEPGDDSTSAAGSDETSATAPRSIGARPMAPASREPQASSVDAFGFDAQALDRGDDAALESDTKWQPPAPSATDAEPASWLSDVPAEASEIASTPAESHSAPASPTAEPVAPAELDPAELDPADLDPADLDPADLDPAELETTDLQTTDETTTTGGAEPPTAVGATQPASPVDSRELARCEGWLRDLEAAKGPKPLAVIEKLFVSAYMPLSGALAAGVHLPGAEAAVEDWATNFAQSYSEAFDALRLRGKRPTMVHDVPDVALRLAKLHGARGTQLLLVDGMRFDVGEQVHRHLERLLAGKAVCAERLLLWSALPTTSAAQIELIGRGANGLRDFTGELDETLLVARGRKARTIRRLKAGHRELLKLDLVEADLSEPGGPAPARLDALAKEVAEHVAAHLEGVPQRSLVMVFGDHGFVLRPRGAGTAAANHGGARPEEVLVPAQAWVVGNLH